MGVKKKLGKILLAVSLVYFILFLIIVWLFSDIKFPSFFSEQPQNVKVEQVGQVEKVERVEQVERVELLTAVVAPATLQLENSQKQNTARPETPPGVKPANIIVEKDGLKIHCRDTSGLEYTQKSCAGRKLLSEIISRLHVLNKCITNNQPRSFDLMVEIDTLSGKTSFLNGGSVDSRNIRDLIKCMQDNLVLPDFSKMSTSFTRYQFLLPLKFQTNKLVHQPAPPDQIQELPDMHPQGQRVKVIKDHVRVRKEPVDGQIFGKIRINNFVVLLEEKDGWCKVVTPNKNIGWMICWSLDI